MKIKMIQCLRLNLFGKEIDNPIGMAAGFDKNAEVYNSLFKLGFGFVEVGTLHHLNNMEIQNQEYLDWLKTKHL